MVKTGFQGVRDDDDTVKTGNVQAITDLGELAARFGNLYSVSRSGNVIDVVDFSKGLGGVSTYASGVGSYVRIGNTPASDGGASGIFGVIGGVSNVAYIMRDLVPPGDQATAIEMWFAAVQNAGKVEGRLNYYDGIKEYLYAWSYDYTTKLLKVPTAGYPLGKTVATVNLYAQTQAYNKVKLYLDLANHVYNRVHFNQTVYLLTDWVPNDNGDTRGPYAEQYFIVYGSAAGTAIVSLGKVITTQAEVMTAC